MSQHAADLCVSLVEHFYGKLSSQTLEALFLHGRSSFNALLHHTRLTPSQLRHSLAVLVQEHFVFWYTSPENDLTYFEADPSGCYGLIRSGKYVRIAEERFGTLTGKVVSHIIQLGHARVADIVQACMDMEIQIPNGLNNGHLDAHGLHMCNGMRSKSTSNKGSRVSTSPERFHGVLSELLQSGLVGITNEFQLHSDADKRFEAEKRIGRRSKLEGKRKKDEAKAFEKAIAAQLEVWKHGTDNEREETTNINGKRKRSLENGAINRDAKRPRLSDGAQVSNEHGLDDNLVLRIDHEKFTVFQRNSCIAELASSSIGSASSQIYSKILQLLEKGTKQCREEPGSPGAVADPDEELNTYGLPRLQTRDIRAIVTDKVELADAIGHADRSKIDMAQFDHPKKRRRKDSSTANGDVKMAKVDGHASSDESEGSEDDQGNVTDVDSDPQIPDEIEEDFDFNPINIVSRKRKRSARPKGPPSPLREHLFLLANQPRPFLHHLPANRSMHESWSVDFHGLSRHLLIDSLFQIIMNRFGSLATRLIRILHEKGKLDEKSLTSRALINQKSMRAVLTAMNRAGFLELQEVPKGNDRQPSKTIFLWFFDVERCRRRVLDETYKTMTRVLQRIGVERERVKDTVDKSERVDVQGHEEEMMTEAEKKALEEWRAKEEQLLGELGKLDDLVAVLRDF